MTNMSVFCAGYDLPNLKRAAVRPLSDCLDTLDTPKGRN